MHPAFSVLFFTVTAGFGYGFMFCLLLAQASGYSALHTDQFVQCLAVAFGLITLGLLSSTLHLANPKNAWRSLLRVRTSWLSREGVLAILAYPLLAAAGWALYSNQASSLVWFLVGFSCLWIIALVYSTAMIYASLKTIPQWNNRLVPAAFLLLALISGVLCLGLVLQWHNSSFTFFAILLLAAGLSLKYCYFRLVGRPTRTSINSATSFSQAKVTLFDAGHSSSNFIQREFVYEVGPQTLRLARRAVYGLVFIIPAAALLVEGGLVAGWLALVSAFIGLLLERWLFFVEAKHVVRHYYDA